MRQPWKRSSSGIAVNRLLQWKWDFTQAMEEYLEAEEVRHQDQELPDRLRQLNAESISNNPTPSTRSKEIVSSGWRFSAS